MEISEQNRFFGVPESTKDFLAQKAQIFLTHKMHIPEDVEIAIRVTKKQGRYYVSEWRTGKQAFHGKIHESPIARISPVPGKKGLWQLAWMMRDMKWHNLIGEEYCGSFDHCLETIVEDPDSTFWG